MTETIATRQKGDIDQILAGETDNAELKSQSVRGGAATVLGQGVTLALQICSTVVLARLLSPADYGLQGMVVTLTGFFSLFKDAGLSVASVQQQVLTHEQASTLFWINVGLGTGLTIVVAAAGPLLVTFYNEPRLFHVTIASASVFLFNSVAVQHRALLNRAMRFTANVKIEVISLGIGACAGIILAALGFGYWALVGQAISSAAASAAGAWIAMPWRPGRPKSNSGVRSMVRFGGTVTLNSLVVYLAYNTEKILLGRVWGAEALGLYGRAYQLANLPVQQLTGAASSVVFPVLSRMQSDVQRLNRTFLKSYSVIVALTIPAVLSCALFADEIISVLLGGKWAGTAVVLRLLAPTVLVFALVNPFSPFLRATGRVGRSLKTALLIAPVVALGIIAGLRHGPAGVAMGYSSAMVLLFLPLVVWAKHGTGITNGDYWDSLKRPLISAAIGGAAGWLFKFAFQTDLAPVSMLILGLPCSIGVYAFLLLIVMKQKDMYAGLLSHLLQRKGPAPVEG